MAVESASHDERAALIEEGLAPTERPLYGLLSVEKPVRSTIWSKIPA